MKLVFRDDDVSKDTDLKRFKEIHEFFNKYEVTHTIALICKDIEQNKALVKYIKSQKNIDIQIHCWEHKNLTENLQTLSGELQKCLQIIRTIFGKQPTILYPPWNKTSFSVNNIARSLRLTVSAEKISLSQYLKGVKGEVINFHSWADECVDLEPALKKYIGK